MYDLVTLGEVLLRLAIPSPTRFETARHLDLQVGGAEANVAAACARLGLRAAWISALPANPWGERIRRELAGNGVDCAYVRMTEDARVGVYFLEYGVPPRPVRVLYDRRDSAFARLTPAQVDWEPVRRARLVHLTGVTPALGESARALVERAVRERQRCRSTSTIARPSGRPRRRARSSSPYCRACATSSSDRRKRARCSACRARPSRPSTGWRASRPRRRSACSRAKRARRCSTAARSFGPDDGLPSRSSTRSAPAMRTRPGSCGPC